MKELNFLLLESIEPTDSNLLNLFFMMPVPDWTIAVVVPFSPLQIQRKTDQEELILEVGRVRPIALALQTKHKLEPLDAWAKAATLR